MKGMTNWTKKVLIGLLMLAFVTGAIGGFPSVCLASQKNADDGVITLRVCNWEEYIDLGEWDEEETIDLESGDILGVNPMYEDFEEWYYETYGRRVKVEYSCFGTNEDLYNMLTLGDVYDLVCPSDYLIMKLMAENKLVPFSEEFFDEEREENYYIRGVSPFIRETFDSNTIGGERWSKYSAGFMWGVTGILYNPEMVTEEEAATWTIINNDKFRRQVTIKDNVRDSLFAAVGAIKADLLLNPDFLRREDYHEQLALEMNDVSTPTIDAARNYLQQTKENVYSFETDSGKADMITGKVLASYQWSGDAVYAMDQAEEDDFYLNFAIPVECTNLYFDGWVMLKCGVEGDPDRQHAAEAFVNFVSAPENAVRNMYYIGYTSVISGGDSDVVYEYLDWCYSADEDAEDVVDYPVGYFFSGDNSDEDYILQVEREQTMRQMAAQYPSEEVMARSAVMEYFDDRASAEINQMWIDVRCFNLRQVPAWAWILAGVILCAVIYVLVRQKNQKDT